MADKIVRTFLTFFANADGTNVVTGILSDGTLTDAGSRPLDQAAGTDVATGLLDGSITCASIMKVGAAQRRSLKVHGYGRADYIPARIVPKDAYKTFAAFAVENAVAKGLKARDGKAVVALVRSRYGL